MKAIVQHRYGPPETLEVEEVPTPVPGEGEVLVRVRAAGVNAGDWHLMRADPFIVRIAMGGLLRPRHKILGSDVAGTVEAVGPGVTRFQAGDRVFGDLSGSGFGAFAEMACAREDVFVPVPDGVDFDQAAAVPVAAGAALRSLRDKGRIGPGQRVMIHGASGGVGTFAIQIAKVFGATVTGVCSTRNVDMVRSLGADRVIDYTREDLSSAGGGYDLILDTAAHHPLSTYQALLGPQGAYVMVGGPVSSMFRVMLKGRWVTRGTGQRMEFFLSEANRQDLETLAGWMGSGAVRAAIQRSFSLDQVPDAIRFLEERRSSGKVVIQVDGRTRDPVAP